MFEISLGEQQAKGDLWWTLRCLQELGWNKEADDLISNRQQIEASDNLLLKAQLYRALGATDEYVEIRKQMDRAEEE